MSKFCKKGTKKGLLKKFVDFKGFQQLSKKQYYTSVFAVNAVIPMNNMAFRVSDYG